MCKAMGTKLPILPVHGPAEARLFSDLVAELPSPLDFDSMAIVWHSKVDGQAIFPKLPVYLRVYHAKWLRNARIRDALSRMAAPLEQLRTRLAADLPPVAPTAAVAPTQPAQHTQHTQPTAPSPAQPVVAQPVARLPQALPKPPVRAVAVRAVADDGTPQVVGGVRIGPSPMAAGEALGGNAVGKRKRGKDGPQVKRARTCKRCEAWGDVVQGKLCRGRTKLGREACEFYSDGEPPEDDLPDYSEKEGDEDGAEAE
jgi:hypothetical protein